VRRVRHSAPCLPWHGLAHFKREVYMLESTTFGMLLGAGGSHLPPACMMSSCIIQQRGARQRAAAHQRAPMQAHGGGVQGVLRDGHQHAVRLGAQQQVHHHVHLHCPRSVSNTGQRGPLARAAHTKHRMHGRGRQSLRLLKHSPRPFLQPLRGLDLAPTCWAKHFLL
jgi:hypothetical protein